MNKLPYSMLKDDGTPLEQGSAGLLRTLTPAGGAQVREYADVTNAATVGAIEIGYSYNVAIDPTTGVWAGRDKAADCWLEKWTDTGSVREFWYAPIAAAGVVPSWTLKFKLDLANGAPQFDNGKHVVTTDFLKAAGIQASISNVYGASHVITASEVGSHIYHSSASASTFTIPLAAGCPSGGIIWITNNGTGVLTLQRSGSDVIFMNNSSVTSITLGTGSSAVLMESGGSWFNIGGSAQLKYAAEFGSSLAASGYQKLPSGLIIQWGTVVLNSAGSVTNSLPISFTAPTARIICSVRGTGYSAPPTSYPMAIGDISSISQYTITSYYGTTSQIDWMAIGY